jgi:hypothetical protein
VDFLTPRYKTGHNSYSNYPTVEKLVSLDRGDNSLSNGMQHDDLPGCCPFQGHVTWPWTWPNFSGSTSLFIFLKFLVQVDYDLKRNSAKFCFGESITSCENCINTFWHDTGCTLTICHLVFTRNYHSKVMADTAELITHKNSASLFSRSWKSFQKGLLHLFLWLKWN